MIDFYATAPQYLDHLAPVWNALPAAERGAFVLAPMPHYGVTTPALAERAARLGIAVTTDLPPDDRPIVVAAVGNLKRTRKLGRTRAALMEHGAGQSYGGDPNAALNSSYPGGRGRQASLFLSPNGHAAARDAAAYPLAQVAVVGCPKLDTLPAPGPRAERPVVAISVHWDCMVCAETRSAWRAFRNGFARLAAEGRYRFLGHGHPRIIAELAREYRAMRIELVTDFEEVVRRADVYLIDNSSTMFEAAAAGLPIVALEPSYYRRSVDHGLRFWDAAGVGIPVRSRGSYDTSLSKKLNAAIEEALADPPERKAAREAALDIVYAFRTGAADRTAEVIGTWATAGQAVAA